MELLCMSIKCWLSPLAFFYSHNMIIPSHVCKVPQTLYSSCTCVTCMKNTNTKKRCYTVYPRLGSNPWHRAIGSVQWYIAILVYPTGGYTPWESSTRRCSSSRRARCTPAQLLHAPGATAREYNARSSRWHACSLENPYYIRSKVNLNRQTEFEEFLYRNRLDLGEEHRLLYVAITDII